MASRALRYPLPLRERVAAISAVTRVYDALWRRGEGVLSEPANRDAA
jgi:hypothetical protein